MKVSIIIPTYKVEKYIVRCLQSVCDQTWDDIECVLIDDCGGDRSIEIAQEFIDNYKGPVEFKICRHEKNMGQAAGRNTGIRNSKGECVYFLDSDDTIVPDCIETLAKLLEKYPDADFAQGNLVSGEGKPCQYSFTDYVPEYCGDKAALQDLIMLKVVTSACNRLIKRKFITDNNLFFPMGMLHEDAYWCYFVGGCAKAAAFTTKGTYYYYTNEGSTMTSVSDAMRRRRLYSRMRAANDYLADIKAKGGTPSKREYVALNFLSCLDELRYLKSPMDWLRFWKKIIAIAFANLGKTTKKRAALFAVMTPPCCFFAGKENMRWRIQNYIIRHI